MVGLLARDRQSLDILSVKKEAKLSTSEIGRPGAEEGQGEEDLQCSSLITVLQSYLELSENEVKY